jgi:hypothetical protein
VRRLVAAFAPLYQEAANAKNLASKPYESGDKSPHSKKNGLSNWFFSDLLASHTRWLLLRLALSKDRLCFHAAPKASRLLIESSLAQEPGCICFESIQHRFGFYHSGHYGMYVVGPDVYRLQNIVTMVANFSNCFLDPLSSSRVECDGGTLQLSSV